MLDSTVLDVVFGLIFVFYTLALVCAGAVEMIANWVKKRAKYLLRGIHDLIDETVPKTGRFVGTPRGWWAETVIEHETYESVLTAGAAAPAAAAPARERRLRGWLLQAPAVAKPAPVGPAPAGQREPLTVADVFGHALVQPYRQTTASGKSTRNPSYLPGAVFAAVLTDLLTRGRAVTPTALQDGLQALPPANDQLRKALEAILKAVKNDADGFVTGVETWFDSQMDRITGSYKRGAKRWVIVVAVVVVGVGGVDSIAIARSLYTDEAVRTTVVQAAEKASTLCPTGMSDVDCAAKARAKVEALGLPLGWASPPTDGWGWVLKGVGLLLSIGAAALGAPFWYKLLDRIGTLRNTGKPPS